MDRKKFIRSALVAATGLPVMMDALGNPGKIPVFQTMPAKNTIAAFSKNFQWLSYAEMAALAAEIGFDGIDLTVRPGGHVEPERVREDLPRAVEAIQKAGLTVPMLTTAIADANAGNAEAIISTASALGIKYYRMGWFPYDKAIGIPANLAQIKQKLVALSALNRQYGIHGAYQNHAGNYFGASIWDLWLELKELDPAFLGCQYDIRHATVEGTGSWEAGLDIVHPYIRSIAIKDFNWTKQGDQWQAASVPLGQGAVDFKKYLSKLQQYHFSGPISLHCEYPLGGAEDGAKKITISRDVFTQAVKTDLTTLRNWLKSGLVPA